MLLSPLFLEDKRKKPERWGLDKGLTGPKWGWFWGKMRLAALMWEGGGTLLYDPSYSQRGTLAGAPSWTAETWGMALSFDGTNDYGYFPHSSPLSLAGDKLTIISLIRPGASTHRVICGKPHTSSHTSPYFKWCLFYDGANMKVYVHGIERASTAKTGNIQTSTQNFLIGQNVAGGERFDGVQGITYVIEDALSPSQMLQIAENPFGPIRMAYGPEVWAQVVTGSPWYAYAQQ